MTVSELLGDGGALSRVLNSYESRPEQLAMARAVEAALASDGALLVEAGTGTGKSLAYLVPAARSGLRVVISTATKALGEQIVERDIPTLRRLGLRPDVALVKGLGNYVCRRRLEEHRRAVASGGTRGDPALGAVLKWVERTQTGDKAELDAVADDALVWRDVTSASETRIGAKCRYFDDCFVTRMRRRAEQAQLIVTNHHMFCADMALRASGAGAQALPDFDAVIFDEAHALEDVATEFFGVRVTRARIDTLLRDAARAFDTSGFFVDASRAASVGRIIAAVSAAAARLFVAFGHGVARGRGATESSLGAAGGRTLLEPSALEGPVGDGVRGLAAALDELHAAVRDFVGAGDALLSVARRTATLREGLAVIASAAKTHVAFYEPDARGGGAIGASPVEIGPILRERLWSRKGAVVMTSATLATAGEQGFAFVRRRLGVPDDAPELTLASPFDYGAQAALYVPRSVPEPRDARYLEAAVDEIQKLVRITRGGAFVLCTSVRAMRAFAEQLRGAWPYPTWVQGEAPKQSLLARFRAAGNGVLIATSSFWEGVDVPGRALRLVIIDKLPFDAPGDPVVSSRIARLTAEGREPFDEYQLPVAALALKQGFGRLIRSRRDAGIVAILDRRIVSRRYGKRLLDALPPASRCASLEELAAFWADRAADGAGAGASGGADEDDDGDDGDRA